MFSSVYDQLDEYEIYTDYLIDGNSKNGEIEATRENAKILFAGCLKEAGKEDGQTGWDYDEWFAIVLLDNHFAYVHYVPAGYSSYTYDPDVSHHVFPNDSWETFVNLRLTQDMRDQVSGMKFETLATLYGGTK